MMKSHKPGRLRMLGGAAAIATLGGLSLAFGSAGAVAQSAPPAQPAPPAAPRAADHDNHRVIVRTIRTEEHRERDDSRAERRSGDGERHVDRRVMVFTHRGEGQGGGRSDHPTVMEWSGRDGHTRLLDAHDCHDADRSEVNEGSGNSRTSVIICSRGDGERSAAQRAEALQRARARLAGDDDIPVEHRQRVLAAIDREIARLRAQ